MYTSTWFYSLIYSINIECLQCARLLSNHWRNPSEQNRWKSCKFHSSILFLTHGNHHCCQYVSFQREVMSVRASVALVLFLSQCKCSKTFTPFCTSISHWLPCFGDHCCMSTENCLFFFFLFYSCTEPHSDVSWFIWPGPWASKILSVFCNKWCYNEKKPPPFITFHTCASIFIG